MSPLLANVYLHEVFDRWFANEVRPRLRGKAHLVRYADDRVMLFEREEPARRGSGHRGCHSLPAHLPREEIRLQPTEA